MRILSLSVKGEWFKQVQAGTKPDEYRLTSPYWKKRLEGRSYDQIHYKLGYPRKGDSERILVFPWNGYKVQTITHPHFGKEPVEVFAIHLSPNQKSP